MGASALKAIRVRSPRAAVVPTTQVHSRLHSALTSIFTPFTSLRTELLLQQKVKRFV